MEKSDYNNGEGKIIHFHSVIIKKTNPIQVLKSKAAQLKNLKCRLLKTTCMTGKRTQRKKLGEIETMWLTRIEIEPFRSN